METSRRATVSFWRRKPALWQFEDSFDIQVPCKDDAFKFSVTTREIWSGQGRFDEVALAIAAKKPAYRATVRQRLRTVARDYPADQSADMENAANEELGPPETLADKPRLDCACSFEVAPDEAVMEHLRHVELNRLAAAASRGTTEETLDRLTNLEADWLAALKRLGGDPFGPTIARLAGDQELADAITLYMTKREQDTQELRSLYDTAAGAFHEIGIYDFAMTTDNAFRRLLDHINQQPAPGLNGHGNGQNGHGPRLAR